MSLNSSASTQGPWASALILKVMELDLAAKGNGRHSLYSEWPLLHRGL